MADHLVIVTDGRALVRVQQGLARYLPGLPARLEPLGADRALLAAPLLRALRIEYGARNVAPILAAIGVAESFEVGAEATAALLRARDTSRLPSRAALRAAPPAPVDWHLAATRVPQAWALLPGAPDAIDWSGVRVGHIDTGYTQHPVFGFGAGGAAGWVDVAQGRTFFAGSNPGDDPGPGGGVDPLASSMDGHGTRIGSVICGHDAAAPLGGYLGVAPKAPLVPVRIANHVLIDHAQRQFAQAVEHLVAIAQVNVINLSMGVVFGGTRSAMRRAVNQAYDAGVILVCAAGNFVPRVVRPARLGRTLAIAGSTPSSRPWPASSFGPEVDWSAPADEIRRATAGHDGGFGYAADGDGTSYSTAITTGAAALWLAHRRAEIAARYPLPWQRVEAFARLAAGTAAVPPDWHPGAFGSGILDVHALLAAPLPDPADLQQAPPI